MYIICYQKFIFYSLMVYKMVIIEKKADWVYESSADNLKEIDWVKSQTQQALEGLKDELSAAWIKDVNDFYEKKDDGTVAYRMWVVEKYLESLKDKSWADLKKENSGAWIIAVQIALESQGYEVGKIDWVLWNETAGAVRKFQSENWLKVDGAPGKDTISRLLEKLWAPVEVSTETDTPADEWTDTPADKWIDAPADKWIDTPTETEDAKIMVERVSLNDGFPRYTYTWEVDAEWKPNWKWSVEFVSGRNVNKFEWVWEHWRIVECTSYGNTLKIKYNTEWDAIFETKSWRTLKIENKNIDHVGRTASIINYIFKVVWDSGKKFDHFYMNNDHHLRVKYKDDTYRKMLSSAYSQMRIDHSEDLVGRLNEYSKEVEK